MPKPELLCCGASFMPYTLRIGTSCIGDDVTVYANLQASQCFFPFHTCSVSPPSFEIPLKEPVCAHYACSIDGYVQENRVQIFGL